MVEETEQLEDHCHPLKNVDTRVTVTAAPMSK